MLVLHFGLYVVEHFILPTPRAVLTAVSHFSRYQSGQYATAHADIKNAVGYFTGDTVGHFIFPTLVAVLAAVGHFSRYQSGQRAAAFADIKNTARYFTGECRLGRGRSWSYCQPHEPHCASQQSNLFCTDCSMRSGLFRQDYIFLSWGAPSFCTSFPYLMAPPSNIYIYKGWGKYYIGYFILIYI